MTFEGPKPTAKDYLHKGIKAVVASFPGVGAIAAEVFSTIFEAPVAKRRSEWINSIANSLLELEKKVKGFSIENLSQNEMFITATLQATHISMRNISYYSSPYIIVCHAGCKKRQPSRQSFIYKSKIRDK